MCLSEVVEEIREKLLHHRLTGRKTLWPTMLKQIAEQDSFDGAYADTILEMIRSVLRRLDDAAIISLWRETETGMCDETEDACLFPDDLRMDVEMELLQKVTDLAWAEATGSRPKRRRSDFDESDCD
jgi:hypothetical protein